MKDILVTFHVMTGCDSVSSFYGIGKKSIWKNVIRSSEAKDLLRDFSNTALKDFVIKYIYNDRKSSTLAEMRENRWSKMKKNHWLDWELMKTPVCREIEELGIKLISLRTSPFLL